MSIEARELSIKGDAAVWRGVDEQTDFAPAGGAFQQLLNCYVAKDGTEIRRIPGWVAVADPWWSTESPLSINALTNASPAAVTVNANHGMLTGYRVRFSGNTDIPDGVYTATRTGATTFTIPYDNTGGTGATDGTVHPVYLDKPSGLRWALEHLVLVARDKGDIDGSGAKETKHIASWARQGGVPSTATDLASDFERWPSPNRSVATTATRDMPMVRWRPHIESIGRKVVIAVPGYGCCFQVDLGHLEYTTELKETHLLGVPKGVINLSQSQLAAGGSLVVGRKYYIAVAFQYPHTGEIGLVSDPVDRTPTTGLQTIDIIWVKPRSCLREAPTRVNVLVFAGEDPTSMKLVHTQEDTGTGNATKYSLTSFPVTGQIDRRIPILELTPMGAKWALGLRGFTFMGGSMGLWGPSRGHVPVTTRAFDATTGQTKFWIVDNSLWVAGTEQVNAAYAGRIDEVEAGIFDPPVSSSLTSSFATLKSLTAGTGSPTPLLVWDTDRNDVTLTTPDTSSSILLPRGHFWYSEEAHPGVVPAINRGFLDSHTGGDAEGGVRYGQSVIVCSQSETYLYPFARHPRGSEARLVSETFGTISSRAMVEFDGGAAWLSHRGPVAYRGQGVEWIGKRVFDTFKTMKRDLRGMMPHAFAAHDPERGLVWFGLRSDRIDTSYESATRDFTIGAVTTANPVEITLTSPQEHYIGKDATFTTTISGNSAPGILNGTWLATSTAKNKFTIPVDNSAATAVADGTAAIFSDDAASFVPCDHFLLWSYRSDSWSEWRPPTHLVGIWDMARVRCDDGVWRMAMLAGTDDKALVYLLDDTFYDKVQGAAFATGTVNDSNLGSLNYFEAQTTFTNMTPEVGMSYIIEDAANSAMRGYGEITAVNSATRVTLDQTVTLQSGDRIAIGSIHATVKTNKLGLGGARRMGRITSVNLRHEAMPGAWVRAQLVDEGGTATALPDTQPVDSRTSIIGGSSRVRDGYIEMDVAGIHQLRLKDIVLEASPGG